MLNLEEINMSEEEMIRSYDPHNEENNYHLPNHLYKQLQMGQYRQACSEVVPNAVYISGYKVPSDRDCLHKHGITHIVNMAADVCENHFPDEFAYMTYYLKDSNNEDMSAIFYRTLEFMHGVVMRGGRVLVHCREGVSRSATMVLAYMMWRFKMPFDQAHECLRKVRPICNPNTAFTCQLLVLGKKLGAAGGAGASPLSAASPTARPLVFRVAPHHPKEPLLLLMAVDVSAVAARHQHQPLLDPRFGWVVQRGAEWLLWLGARIPDEGAVRDAVQQHAQWLLSFEGLRYAVTPLREAAEPPDFWEALGLGGERRDLVGERSAFDADFDVLRGITAREAPSAGDDHAAAAAAARRTETWLAGAAGAGAAPR